MAADLDRIRRETSLSDLALSYGVALQRDGHEFVACCPFHAEDTASFTIFRGKDGVERYHCFGCGAKGDVLDFVQEIKGIKDLREAIRILGGEVSMPNVQPKQIKARDVYEGIIPIDPPEEPIVVGKRVRLYNPKRKGDRTEWGAFAPSMVFPYRRADGSLIGYVLRHDLGNGDKETPMVMWVCLPDGTQCWSRYPFPKPRSLYGLQDVADAAQVIVVEGEECRDALADRSGLKVASWPGGTQGVKHVDWSPLAGKNVVIWPDADDPGLGTASEIAAIIHSLNGTPRILDVMGKGA